MAFLNDLGKKIGNAAGAVSDKAKELAEVAKLNNEISKSEKQIRTLYQEIGKIMFEKEKYNTDSPIYQQCVSILSEQQKITELEKKIEVLKSDAEPVAVTTPPQTVEVTCPGCGISVAEGKYCPECGATLVQEGEYTEIK